MIVKRLAAGPVASGGSSLTGYERCDMLNWLNIAMQQEQHQDLVREAQRERLVKQAQQSQGQGHPFYHRAFIWLGKRLVTWGLSLQARFGSMPATLEPAHQPC